MRRAACLLIPFILFHVAVRAEDVPDIEDEVPAVASAEPFSLLTTDRLTGDWGGARSWMEERGVEIGISLTTIYQHNVHGGVQTRNGHRITGSTDWEISLLTQPLGLWNDGLFYMLAESSWNDGIGEDRVANYFGVNADAAGDNSISVSELWYEHSFLNERARFRLGKMDATVDFDTNAYANDETTQFINPALTNTGNIPFPDYGLGAQLMIEPLDWFYAGVVAVDAQTAGRETGFRTALHGEDYFFTAAEIGFMPEPQTPWGVLPGAYRFGVWYDPQPKAKFFDDLDGRRLTIPYKRDDVGFYFNMDQLIFQENPNDATDIQGLGMFVRYGYAHANINELEHFWSVGAQYQGLIPTRDDDVLAFGVAQGILSDRMKLQGDTPHRETVLEMYYSLQLLPWLTLTPDLQWILDPGGMGDGHDAFVAGFRVQASF